MGRSRFLLSGALTAVALAAMSLHQSGADPITATSSPKPSLPVIATPTRTAPPHTTSGASPAPGTPATSAAAGNPADPGYQPTLAMVSTPPAGAPKVLYLTFDDGPSQVNTPAILDALDSVGAHGTFFMIGRQAAANPGLVAQVREHGNAIGNHSYSHADLTTLTDWDISQEVRKTDQAIAGASCVRPPYGATDSRVTAELKALGKRQAFWTIDTKDWQRPGQEAIAAAITGAAPGSVVLLHDGGGDRSQTVAALRAVLPTLVAQGWSFPTLPQC